MAGVRFVLHRESFVELNKLLLNVVFDKILNTVFNAGHMTDAELINHLGGPTKVAELLKYDKQGGVQRVQNWLVRGIPAQVKLDHLELFQVALPATPAPRPPPTPKVDPDDPDSLVGSGE